MQLPSFDQSVYGRPAFNQGTLGGTATRSSTNSPPTPLDQLDDETRPLPLNYDLKDLDPIQPLLTRGDPDDEQFYDRREDDTLREQWLEKYPEYKERFSEENMLRMNGHPIDFLDPAFSENDMANV